MITTCALAVGSVFIMLVASQFAPKYSKLAELACMISLTACAVSSIGTIIGDMISEDVGSAGEYVKILVRMAGVCFCVSISSDFCSDAGYPSVGRAITLAGKAEIIILTLPYLREMFSMLRSLLS